MRTYGMRITYRDVVVESNDCFNSMFKAKKALMKILKSVLANPIAEPLNLVKTWYLDEGIVEDHRTGRKERAEE